MKPPEPSEPVSLQQDTLQTLERLAREFGGIVLVGPNTYLVSDPDLIEQILVVRPGEFKKGRNIQRVAAFLGRGSLLLEGDEWRKRRRLVQPAFSRAHLEAMGPSVVTVTEKHLSRWPQEFDLHAAFVELLMELTVRNIFKQEVTGEIGKLVEAWELLFAHMGNRFADLQAPPPEVVEAKRCVDETLWELITRQRRVGEDGSVLGRLIAAKDEDGTGLSDEELRAEVMTLFVGGYETGATALTFAIAFLSTHPQIAARHLAEVRGHCGVRAVDFPDLASMPYNNWVLRETLRMAPPSWMFTRELIEEGVLGEYELEGGSQLLISPWVMHHDPRWWPEPYRFDPERFAPGSEEGRPRMAWIPFGFGPRKCLGSQLATIELQLILATLVRKVKLSLVADELIPVAKLGLGSTESAIVTCEPRNPT